MDAMVPGTHRIHLPRTLSCLLTHSFVHASSEEARRRMSARGMDSVYQLLLSSALRCGQRPVQLMNAKALFVPPLAVPSSSNAAPTAIQRRKSSYVPIFRQKSIMKRAAKATLQMRNNPQMTVETSSMDVCAQDRVSSAETAHELALHTLEGMPSKRCTHRSQENYD